MERSPEEGPGPSGQPPAADITGDGDSGVLPAGPGAASEALAALTSFGRRLLVLVPVYLAGASGLSVGFVLFGLALYLGWRRVRDGKERSLRAARQLLDDEERITAKTLYMSHRELPAWVSYHVSPCCSQCSFFLVPQLGFPLPMKSVPRLGTAESPASPRTLPRPVSACLLGRTTLSAHSLPQSGSFHRIGTSSLVS